MVGHRDEKIPSRVGGLNLVRYKDLTEPLVQIKAPQESNEKSVNESFKESYPDDATGEFQPYKYYENEYDWTAFT